MTSAAVHLLPARLISRRRSSFSRSTLTLAAEKKFGPGPILRLCDLTVQVTFDHSIVEGPDGAGRAAATGTGRAASTTAAVRMAMDRCAREGMGTVHSYGVAARLPDRSRPCPPVPQIR